jgi:hypothetical protein
MPIKTVRTRQGNYSDLVARYSRAFVNDLEAHHTKHHSDHGAGADLTGAAQKAKEEAKSELNTRHRYLAIDTHGAEVLESGTRIAPESSGGANNWCIFSRITDLPALALNAFSLVGILPKRLTAAEFVEQAYLMVLMRPVDNPGRQSYQPRLETGALTRRSVLRSLAGSKEARSKGVNLIIVPEAGEWGDITSDSAGNVFVVDKPLG